MSATTHIAEGRARSRRARGARGFTLVEVMMSLTVLTIGMLGIISLQRNTVVANAQAQQMTVATNIGRVWIGRLQADASLWNHPSAFNAASDLKTDTKFLTNYGIGWFLPTDPTNQYSYAFSQSGKDIDPTSPALATDTIYCVNVRLTQLYADPLLTTVPSMLRAEVRVYWLKKPGAIATCSGAGGSLSALETDDVTYHWVYSVGAIAKATAQ